MPNIEFSMSDLQDLIKKRVSFEELKDIILFAKGEVDAVEGDIVRVDIKDTNRPDLWSVEGIAREIKGYLEIEKGAPKIPVKKSNVVVNVDKKVQSVRPKIVCAIVKGLNFNDFSIKQMIQLQEKISQTYGRNRKDVAIGIYDFDKIKPPIQYTTVKPDGIRFVPLEFKEEMTPKQILEKHPKGVAYAHLINKYPEYPILIDSAKNVLSMPPIINSDYTGKVTEDTKNVFIEATGYDTDRLLTVLNVITSALFDRGGEIYSTEIFYGDEKITTPDFSLKEFFLDINYCKKLLGIDIKNNEILKLLEKARYDASIKGDKILVKYQAYRNDIMHQNDIIEDIAIKFDYNKIEPEYPNLPTTGSEDKLEIFSNDIRTLMIGLGFQEIINYIMTSTEKQFTKMNEKPENYVEIENPVSAEYSILRTSILPNLLENLSSNKHRRFPQRIFEIGDCVVIEKDTSTKNVRKLAFVISHTNANFSEISSICNAIKENLGLNVQLKPYNIKSMIKGRCAGIYFGNELIGFFGEIHPKVLENWHLEKPVVGFEVNIDKLFEIISTS